MRLSSSFITRWLARRLLARFQRTVVYERSPDLVIGRATEVEPYMLRWHLIPRNRWLNVYLHHVLRNDDDVMHDHPFASLSLCLAGNLGEAYRKPNDALPFFRTMTCGDIVYRSATHTHRLYLEDDRPAWTIFLTGPRVRSWGFHCPKGWKPWREYCDARDRGQVGAGCGEVT